MAKNFTIEFYGNTTPYVPATIAAATVIEAGKMVTLDGAWLIVEATAASTAIAYAPFGSEDGQDIILITDHTKAEEFSFVWVPTQALAAIDKWVLVDIAISWTDQQIDLANAATGVLKVHPDNRAGAIGSTTEVWVTIAKHI